jgi:hypothetical protein
MKRWVIAAIVAACMVLTGCGVPIENEPHHIDRPGVAAGTSRPPSNLFGTAVERLYLVRDNALVRVTRRVPATRTPSQILQDLLAGPTGAEQQDGLSSALTTMHVEGMTVARRRANVAIGERTGARSDEVFAYGQIVCTLTSQGAEVGTVSFSSGGEALRVPRGDGSLSYGPLTVADYAELIRT